MMGSKIPFSSPCHCCIKIDIRRSEGRSQKLGTTWKNY